MILSESFWLSMMKGADIIFNTVSLYFKTYKPVLQGGFSITCSTTPKFNNDRKLNYIWCFMSELVAVNGYTTRISSILMLALWYNRIKFQTLYQLINQWTRAHITGCCNAGYLSKTNLHLKCREISFAHNLLIGRKIVSTIYTVQGQMIC